MPWLVVLLWCRLQGVCIKLNSMCWRQLLFALVVASCINVCIYTISFFANFQEVVPSVSTVLLFVPRLVPGTETKDQGTELPLTYMSNSPLQPSLGNWYQYMYTHCMCTLLHQAVHNWSIVLSPQNLTTIFYIPRIPLLSTCCCFLPLIVYKFLNTLKWIDIWFSKCDFWQQDA